MDIRDSKNHIMVAEAMSEGMKTCQDILVHETAVFSDKLCSIADIAETDRAQLFKIVADLLISASEDKELMEAE